MKVLFVCSGNSDTFLTIPFIKIQADSLKSIGIHVDIYSIRGKGILGYIKHILKLKLYLQRNHYDLVHAHYSLSGIVAYIASKEPVITSLMGSDVNCSKIELMIIRFFTKYLWVKTIVKSKDMKLKLNTKVNVEIVPNGVDMNMFNILDKMYCRKTLGLVLNKQYILFGSDPQRMIKNFALTQAAVDMLSNKDIQILTLVGIQHEKVPLYLNAVDLLALSSDYEGSPNIVKEAMACNCPIVSTDVGDVRWLLNDLNGCYISNKEALEFSQKIEKCLSFGSKTNGRNRLMELSLDAKSVASKLQTIYKAILIDYNVRK